MENFKEIIQNIVFNNISIGTFSLPFSLLNLFLRFVLPLLIIFFILKLIKRSLYLLIGKSKIKDENKAITKKWIKRVLNIIYYILIAVFVSNLLKAETIKYAKKFFNILNQPLIESGGTRITVITIILIIPIFYIGSFIGKTVKKMINADLLDRIGLDDSKKFSFASIIQYAVMIIAIIIGMSIIGIDLSVLTLIFGVLGIGIGFGFQKTVANIIAGFIIVISHPIKEGDRIIINDIEGTVTQIRLHSTNVTTLENENIIVPNSNFVENIVHNFSYENRQIIITNKVQISYDDDPEIAIKLLETIASEQEHVLKDPPPIARFKNFGDSGLDFSLFTCISDLNYKYEVHDRINREIWRRFRENNISIPFPHVQLIMQNGKIIEKNKE